MADHDPVVPFIDAISQCLGAQNWYAALTLALTLPDICASLDSSSDSKNKERYVGWCRRWIEPLFTHGIGPNRTPKVFLSAEDFYQARNSILHSGSNEIAEKRRTELDGFEFFESGGHCNWIGKGMLNGSPTPSYLQLRVDAFCETVLTAVKRWNAEIGQTPEIMDKKQNMLRIHKPGTTIGNIQWG